MNDWISVEERLPESVATTVVIARRTHETMMYWTCRLLTRQDGSKVWVYNDNSVHPVKDDDLWMPLPPPPEAKP